MGVDYETPILKSQEHHTTQLISAPAACNPGKIESGLGEIETLLSALPDRRFENT